MTAYQYLLSESQERMLLVVKEEKLKGGWDSTWYFENLKKLNKSFKKDDENSKRYW